MTFNLVDYKKILQKLIGFNTISSVNKEVDHSNIELLDYVESFYKDLGFYTKRYEVSETKQNLYVTSHKEHGGLMLSGHSDTVSCKSEKWQSNPFELVEKDGFLYGLGSTDMKGYLALMMLFMQNTDLKSLKKPLSALFSCDEESGMDGAFDYCKNYSFKPDLILIGESTENKAVIAHKGYMAFEISITGRACHSSNPDLGLNAVDGAFLLYTHLNKFKEEIKNIEDLRFEVPHPTLNIGVIKGGSSINIVCPQVIVQLDLRAIPNLYSCQRAYESIVSLVDKLNKDSDFSYSVKKIYTDIEPFECSDLSKIELLEEITQSKSLVVNYATEASFLSQIAPCIVLGPGTIKYAHSIDEHIAISEIELSYKHLSLVTDRLCK